MKLLDIGESITTEKIDLEALQSRLYDLEAAQSRAREITKNIKYVDQHMDIIRELEDLAEEVDLQLDDYNVRQVYQAKNNLESAIYELEEAFEDAIRDAQNAVDDAEYDMEEGAKPDFLDLDGDGNKKEPMKKAAKDKKKKSNESLKALARHVKEGVPLPDSLFRYQSEAYFDTFRKAKQLREADALPELDWESEEMLGTDIGESVQLKGIGPVWLDVPYLDESDDYEMTTCDYCHGNEWDPDGPQEDDNYDDCPKCAGTGEIPKSDLGGSLTSEGINEDYDPKLISMLAKFEDDCDEIYRYYGDTDVVTIDELIKAGKAEEAADEMATAMTDQDGGSSKHDHIYALAKDAVDDYMYDMNEAKGDIRKALGGVALAGLLGYGAMKSNNDMDQQAYSKSVQLPQLELYLDYAEQQGDQRMIKQLKQRIGNHKMRLSLGKGDVRDSNNRPIEVVYDKEGKEQGPVKEAEYNGKDVELNKPKRGGSKKYYVYVKNPKTGRVKKISFGDVTGLKTKSGNKKRAKSFAARHNCEKKNDKMKAGYWACRLPRYGLVKGGQWW